MDLLEYQAKELFNEVGIPTLSSQTIHHPGELKRLHIPYPVVLKSQVRAGGRGRSGGIRFVENTIDAIAAARGIFNLAILGEYPEVLLAEARYDTQQEIFLAVVLDYQIQRPVLLGSYKGGIDIETLLDHMQKIVIDDEFYPFHARRLAKKMGIKEELIQSVSTIIEQMYNLFITRDLDIVEINPLGVSSDGKLMALDGKITVNNAALARHPDLISLLTLHKPPQETALEELEGNEPETEVQLKWLDEADDKGNVGIIANSVGLGLTIWDLVTQEKAKPACCLIVQENLSTLSVAQQLETGIEQMMELSGIKVILINILSYAKSATEIAQALNDYFQPQLKQQLSPPAEERTPRATASTPAGRKRGVKTRSAQVHTEQLQWVIRIFNGDLDPIKESLSPLPITWADSLEEAITQTISLLKSK